MGRQGESWPLKSSSDLRRRGNGAEGSHAAGRTPWLRAQHPGSDTGGRGGGDGVPESEVPEVVLGT